MEEDTMYLVVEVFMFYTWSNVVPAKLSMDVMSSLKCNTKVAILFVLGFLILLYGDVELNPGPLPKPSTPKPAPPPKPNMEKSTSDPKTQGLPFNSADVRQKPDPQNIPAQHSHCEHQQLETCLTDGRVSKEQPPLKDNITFNQANPVSDYQETKSLSGHKLMKKKTPPAVPVKTLPPVPVKTPLVSVKTPPSVPEKTPQSIPAKTPPPLLAKTPPSVPEKTEQPVSMKSPPPVPAKPFSVTKQKTSNTGEGNEPKPNTEAVQSTGDFTSITASLNSQAQVNHITHLVTLEEKIEYLNESVVPVKDLEYADYCALIIMDFSLKRRDPGYVTQIESVGRMCCAMLNHSGGIITLKQSSTCSEKNIDEWVEKILQHIEISVPKSVRSMCIEFKMAKLEIWVKKSPQLITYKSNLYICIENTTTEVESSMMSNVLKKSEHKCISRVDGILWSQLVHMDTFEPREDKHLEFKQFTTATDGQSLVEKILGDRVRGECKTIRSLLAFANTAGGGDLIIGIGEDKTGNRVLKGQKLLPHEKEIISAKFKDALAAAGDGSKRIWGSPQYEPIESIDYLMKFYLLLSNEQEDIYLIHVRMNQFREAVFGSRPECYTLTDDGQVTYIELDGWKQHTEKGYNTNHPNSNIEIQGGDQNEPGQIERASTVGTEFTLSVDLLESLSKELKEYKQSLPQEVTKQVSWTEDSDYWNDDKDVESGYDMNTYIRELAASEVLTPVSPLKWFPAENLLQQMTTGSSTDINPMIQELKDIYKDNSGVILGTSSFNDLFPSLKIPFIHKPVLDLVVLLGTGKLELLTICLKHGDIDTHVEYILNTIWHLKCKLLNAMHHSGKFGSIGITGHVWCIEDNNRSYTIKHPQNCSVQLRIMQQAIATLLIQGKSCIKTRIGEEYLSVLTKDQLCGLLIYDFAQVNIIQGPPGSGKTVMALHICDRESKSRGLAKDQILYLCPNVPLAEYVRFQGKCRVQVVTTGEKLLKVIKEAKETDVLCIIIDDAQLIKCTKLHWLSIFRVLDVNTVLIKLVILIDSVFQNFLSVHDKELDYSIIDYKYENPFFTIVMHPALHEMLRNGRKVFSFFKSNADEQGKHKLVCRHNFLGDDVMIQYCENFFQYSSENPVITLVENIIGTFNIEEGFWYSAKDVAVLVDFNGKGEGEQQVESYINIFTQFCPEVKVQRATKVPADGLIIEQLKNFSGLETRVCILALTSFEDSVIKLMENPRYRLFVASRGITKVVFLLHGQCVTSTLDMLKFSAERMWTKYTHKVWNDTCDAILRQPTIKLINLHKYGVPDTSQAITWNQLLTSRIMLTTMLTNCQDVMEVVNWISNNISEEHQSETINYCVIYILRNAYHTVVEEWVIEHVPQDHVSKMQYMVLLHKIFGREPAGSIHNWLTSLTQPEIQDRLRTLWKELITYWCQKKIKHGNHKTMSEVSALDAWRNDPDFTYAVMTSVCEKVLMHIDDLSEVAKHILGNVNCLFGVQPVNQVMALTAVYNSTFGKGYTSDVMVEILRLLWHDNYIDREVMHEWLMESIDDTLKDDPQIKVIIEEIKLQNFHDVLMEMMESKQPINHIKMWVKTSLPWNQYSTVTDICDDDWYTMPHYQRVVTNALCQHVVNRENSTVSVNCSLLRTFLRTIYEGASGVATTDMVCYTFGQPPELISAFFESLMRFHPDVAVAKWKAIPMVPDVLKQRNEIATLLDEKKSSEEIHVWLNENIDDTRKRALDIYMFIVKYLIATSQPPIEIRDFIMRILPARRLEEIHLTWKVYCTELCCEYIEVNDYNPVAHWMDTHILPSWRHDVTFTGSIFHAIYTTCTVKPYGDLPHVNMTKLKGYLGSTNCLFDAPRDIQYSALMQATQCGIYNQVITYLLSNSYIKKGVLRDWIDGLDQDTKKLCNVTITHDIPDMEEEIGDMMKNLIGENQLRAWIDDKCKDMAWYNLPHYQRVVLLALSTQAVRIRGNSSFIDRTLLRKYMNPLFKDTSETQQMMYSVQSVVASLPPTEEFAIALYETLLSIVRPDKRCPFTIDAFLQWRDTKTPSYTTGRARVLDEVVSISTEVEQTKCVLVGDGCVGLTCLIEVYKTRLFPQYYSVTIFEQYYLEIMVDKIREALSLWDTAGQEDYDRLRPLSYPEAEVFLVCFSIESPDSYENIREKWIPEVRHHCPDVPVLLIGTKLDMRYNPAVLKSLAEKKQSPVSTEQGERLASRIGAVKYLECSALTFEGIEEVYVELVRAARVYKKSKLKQEKSTKQSKKFWNPKGKKKKVSHVKKEHK